MTRVLFVCHGNICRSPMAEALARSVAKDRSISFHSAGTHAGADGAATAAAVEAVAELGIDLRGHRAEALDDAVDRHPDRVYVMTTAQQAEVVSRFPRLRDRIALLDPEGYDVADPYGLDAEVYRSTRDHILRAVTARFG